MPLIIFFLSLFMASVMVAGSEQVSPATVLLPSQVLESVSAHYPGIIESIADQRVAEARALGARGAFDLIFGGESFNRADGFYDSRYLEGQASRYLSARGGPRIYGGYRVSNGNFPIYEDERFTNTGGQVKLGALFSLLRDREIDPRRFNVTDTRLATREAEFNVLLTRIGVARQALVAYWRWVALGQKRKVYENLVNIALEREVGLEREVRQGARAAIVVTENRQNIIRRQSLLAAAKRDFNMAANDLSLYYRDNNGVPLIVTPDRLPPYQPLPQPEDSWHVLKDLNSMFDSRPELKRLRNTITRAIRRIDLNENALLPRFDLNLEMAQPLGAVAEGGSSRDETDVVIGFRFSVPFEQRAARGKLAETKARLTALRQKERLMEDKIQLEVSNILLDLSAAEELLALAKQEVTQAETLRDAEMRRFEQGASDFFLVNIRENTAAEARIQYYLAGLKREIAQANFDAATVNLKRLGIN